MVGGNNLQKVLLLSGPTGAGKTTSLRELRFQVDRNHKLAIIERDDVANMAGRQAIIPGTEHHKLVDLVSWEESLRLVDGFLKGGFDVVFATPINDAELYEFRQRFRDSATVIAVVLLPEWNVAKVRRERRIETQPYDPRATQELARLTPSEHEAMYQGHKSMADRGMFDVVINGDLLTPTSVALRLRKVLITSRSGDYSSNEFGSASKLGNKSHFHF